MNTPFTIWCTGLPSSGGTALAKVIADLLEEQKLPVQLLLSTSLRQSNTMEPLGFGKNDRDKNVAQLGERAHRAMKEGAVVVVAAVSPFADARHAVRQKVGAFFEVHVCTPKPACIDQCTTGNWAKALTGELRDFTGVDQPYEKPTQPDCEVDLSVLTIADGAQSVIHALERAGHLPASADADPG